MNRFKKFFPYILPLFFFLQFNAFAGHESNKTIFLTFDDGPINITKDIVEILNKNNIKATFFINGTHLFGTGGENEKNSIISLNALLESGHIIANHSYNHMMGDYYNCKKENVYDEHFNNNFCSELSLRTYFDPKTDFVFFKPLNSIKIENVIYDKDYFTGKKTKKNYYHNIHLKDIARIPFTNNWRVSSENEHLTGNAPCATTDMKPLREYTDEDYAQCFASPTRSSKNASLLANHMHKKGFQVFGWDINWAPKNWDNHAADTLISAKELEIYTEQAFYECIPKSKNNSLQSDRVPDLNCESPLHQNKVIILTHDFLFETGSRGNGSKNLVELDKFIREMHTKGYQFDTLDHYVQISHPKI